MTAVSTAAAPIVSLRDYSEQWQRLHLDAHRDHMGAHDREHLAAQTAIDRASDLAKENKAAANEWRDAMNDRERNFAKVEMMDASRARIDLLERTYVPTVVMDALILRVTTLEKANLTQTVREDERAKSQGRTIAIVGLLATISGFVLSLLSRLLGLG